jgi:hypothetical protein
MQQSRPYFTSYEVQRTVFYYRKRYESNWREVFSHRKVLNAVHIGIYEHYGKTFIIRQLEVINVINSITIKFKYYCFNAIVLHWLLILTTASTCSGTAVQRVWSQYDVTPRGLRVIFLFVSDFPSARCQPIETRHTIQLHLKISTHHMTHTVV